MQFFRLVALMVIMALLLSACGPATPTAADEVTDSGQRFTLSLPRLVIDVDNDGRFSFGGFGLADLERLTGVGVPSVGINKFYVDWFVFTNVQHLELVHSSDGIFLYANGEPLPYLAWDGESLSNLGSVAGILNAQYAKLIGMLIPIIQRTGLNVVLRFPLQPGAEPIPLRDASAPPEPVIVTAEDTSAVAHLEIDYDSEGVPMLAGITSRDVLQTTGYNLAMVELSPDVISLLQAFNVQHVRLVSNGDGVFLSVNDMVLPHIAWNDSYLVNSADFYAQMNPDSPYIELANLLLPEVNNIDIDLLVRFPTQ